MESQDSTAYTRTRRPCQNAGRLPIRRPAAYGQSGQNGPEWCWHRPPRARACQGRCQIVILHPPFVLSEGACMRFGPGTGAGGPLAAPSHDPCGLPYRARRPCGKRAKRCTATRPLRNGRCRPKACASIGASRVDTPRRAARPRGRLSQEPGPILGKDGRL